jgi:lipid II:glycine glycyltransferase (peptidoglycan interpeptide bridge formation enzyme)
MTSITQSLATVPAERAVTGTARATPVMLARVDAADWDTIAAGFQGLCQEQLMAFAAVRWPGTEHEPLVFMIRGEVVGGALVIIQHLPLGLGSIAIAKWGPMLADTKRADAINIYAGMVEAMIAEYSQKRGMMLSLVNRAAVREVNDEYEHLMARGFKPGVLLNYPLRYIVNLRLTDAEQRKSLEQKWRYQLGKSEKEGLVFEHGGVERLAEFTTLYESMLDRKKFADYSAYETIPHLMALKNEQARPELFFVRKDGEVIAGAIIFKGGDRAVYLYGATLEKALPLRAGYFLHWNIIRWLRDHTRADWYDLGGTDGFMGLHQFKKGMVGSAGNITPVPRVANYADRGLAFFFGNSALWAREGVHEVLRRVSRLRKDRAQPTMPRYIDQPTDARL